MTISEILRNKEEELSRTCNPLQVRFTLDEVNVLADINALRQFKLTFSMPQSFEVSRDLFDCTKRILAGDTIYRVLEFCVLKNKVLKAPVSQVFARLFYD